MTIEKTIQANGVVSYLDTETGIRITQVPPYALDERNNAINLIAISNTSDTDFTGDFYANFRARSTFIFGTSQTGVLGVSNQARWVEIINDNGELVPISGQDLANGSDVFNVTELRIGRQDQNRIDDYAGDVLEPFDEDGTIARFNFSKPSPSSGISFTQVDSVIPAGQGFGLHIKGSRLEFGDLPSQELDGLFFDQQGLPLYGPEGYLANLLAQNAQGTAINVKSASTGSLNFVEAGDFTYSFVNSEEVEVDFEDGIEVTTEQLSSGDILYTINGTTDESGAIDFSTNKLLTEESSSAIIQDSIADVKLAETIELQEIPPDSLFSIAPVTEQVLEGGKTEIRVTRQDSSVAASVDVVSSSGSAESGADFVPISTRVFFQAGQTTSRAVEVAARIDGVVEGDESFTVGLANPSAGSTIIQGQSTITIEDTTPEPDPTPVEDPTDGGEGIFDVSTDSEPTDTPTLGLEGNTTEGVEGTDYYKTAYEGTGDSFKTKGILGDEFFFQVSAGTREGGTNGTYAVAMVRNDELNGDKVLQEGRYALSESFQINDGEQVLASINTDDIDALRGISGAKAGFDSWLVSVDDDSKVGGKKWTGNANMPFTDKFEAAESFDIDPLTGMNVASGENFSAVYRRDANPDKEATDRLGYKGSDGENTYFVMKDAAGDSLIEGGKNYAVMLVEKGTSLEDALVSGDYVSSGAFTAGSGTRDFISMDNGAIDAFKAGDSANQKYQAILYDADSMEAVMTRGVGKLAKETSDKFDARYSRLNAAADDLVDVGPLIDLQQPLDLGLI